MKICFSGNWIEYLKLLFSFLTLVLAAIGLFNWIFTMKGKYKFDIESKIFSKINKIKSKLWSLEKVLTINGIEEKTDDFQNCDFAMSQFPKEIKLLSDTYEELRDNFDEEKNWLSKKFPTLEKIIDDIQLDNYYFGFLYPHSDIKNIVAGMNKDLKITKDSRYALIDERIVLSEQIIKDIDNLNKRRK